MLKKRGTFYTIVNSPRHTLIYQCRRILMGRTVQELLTTLNCLTLIIRFRRRISRKRPYQR